MDTTAPLRRATIRHPTPGDVDEHPVHRGGGAGVTGGDQLVAAVSPAALGLAGDHPLAGVVRDFLADQEFG